VISAPKMVRRCSPAPLATPMAADTQMAVAVVRPLICFGLSLFEIRALRGRDPRSVF
jgi:hypothetical protein